MKHWVQRGIRLLIWIAAMSSGATAMATPRTDLIVERAVLVMRHGIRAPLDGEVPRDTRTDKPWVSWPVAQSAITPHGERALEIVAAADRQMLAARGLLPRTGCPDAYIHTNSSIRTIASGHAYARGFAPGCTIAIAHRPIGEADPVFEPLRARATDFDAKEAVTAINRETGGMAHLVERHGAALAELDRVLGCTPRGTGCVPAGDPALTASADGRDITLSGAIRATSGIAQVLLLEYVEGMPLANVGWGRVDSDGLRRLGALHAALFAVYTKPSYMAAHQSAALGREVLDALDAGAPHRFEIVMGHDTNVTALAAALGVELDAPGYAINDVPPGGALLLERIRDQRSGRSFARVSYRTQSPDALRHLSPAVSVTPLKVTGCGKILCPIEKFERLLKSRISGVE
ncbi:histidine-type phosphatase [Sphingobium sp. BYY-5]|uniref:histidine-type phosphatase n=1 Tax=Sphingobium sp. BYY-5 TaxID=2926400 RepID=UPI001FA764DB|nr:histidine-type phosphatase [Sphingobium sp. BYY-5]MCI4592110.1 histidine-type phosphatase [Sphingobium sp. BYY-5]